MNTNTKSPFLNTIVGKTANNSLHAFHVEGFIAKAPFTKEGKKGLFLSTSLGIGQPTEAVLARATGQYDPNKAYGGGEFATINFFGALAETFSAECQVGMKVAVSGKLEERPFTRKDGTEGKELVITATNYALMGTKKYEGKIAPRVMVSSHTYIGQDGVARATPWLELLTGTVVGADKGLSCGESGTSYFRFGVKTLFPVDMLGDLGSAIPTEGKEYDQTKKILNVSVFRKQAERLAKVIRDGEEVVLTGPVSVSEYNGATRVEMHPWVVAISKFVPASATAVPPAQEGTVAAAAQTANPAPVPEFQSFADDGDADGLPF